MKKVLGILFVMVIMAVSALAAPSDLEIVPVFYLEIVPVFLRIPEFVKLSVAPGDDGRFELFFDPAYPDVTVQDTVKLLAKANINYTVEVSSVNPVSGYESWAKLVNISIDTLATGFGTPGVVTFNTTATINWMMSVIDTLYLGPIPSATHIADVVFTISAML